MKKICLAIILSAFMVSSCSKEKDRECKCTNIHTDGSTSTSSIVYKNVTKKEAKTLCKGYTYTVSNLTVTKECKLE